MENNIIDYKRLYELSIIEKLNGTDAAKLTL